jgi:hypothetical protein
MLPGREPGLSRWEASDHPLEQQHGLEPSVNHHRHSTPQNPINANNFPLIISSWVLPEQLSIYPSIHPSIYSPFVGPSPLFQFLNPMHIVWNINNILVEHLMCTVELIWPNLLHFNNYFHFVIPVIKFFGRTAFTSIRSARWFWILIPVAPSGAEGICETLAPDPVNSSSFNLAL